MKKQAQEKLYQERLNKALTKASNDFIEAVLRGVQEMANETGADFTTQLLNCYSNMLLHTATMNLQFHEAVMKMVKDAEKKFNEQPKGHRGGMAG